MKEVIWCFIFSVLMFQIVYSFHKNESCEIYFRSFFSVKIQKCCGRI